MLKQLFPAYFKVTEEPNAIYDQAYDGESQFSTHQILWLLFPQDFQTQKPSFHYHEQPVPE